MSTRSSLSLGPLLTDWWLHDVQLLLDSSYIAFGKYIHIHKKIHKKHPKKQGIHGNSLRADSNSCNCCRMSNKPHASFVFKVCVRRLTRGLVAMRAFLSRLCTCVQYLHLRFLRNVHWEQRWEETGGLNEAFKGVITQHEGSAADWQDAADWSLKPTAKWNGFLITPTCWHKAISEDVMNKLWAIFIEEGR